MGNKKLSLLGTFLGRADIEMSALVLPDFSLTRYEIFILIRYGQPENVLVVKAGGDGLHC